MSGKLHIRLWQDSDNVSELTELLHRAYKPLADAGMRFLATHQSDEITLDRIQSGKCFLGELDSKVIATGTLYMSKKDVEYTTPWYRREDVASFGQFAVEPELQAFGYGKQMLDHIEHEARKLGFKELALDTAETAHQLIAYYERQGFRFIEFTKWDVVNYRSMIMSKTL